MVLINSLESIYLSLMCILHVGASATIVIMLGSTLSFFILFNNFAHGIGLKVSTESPKHQQDLLLPVVCLCRKLALFHNFLAVFFSLMLSCAHLIQMLMYFVDSLVVVLEEKKRKTRLPKEMMLWLKYLQAWRISMLETQ